jgi:hypothetical protein
MTLYKKLIIISTGLLLLNFSAKAQFVSGASGYDEIALLSSYTNITGSARMLGIGGAQMSLGGDIGSIYANPAGLGFYNRSEVSFTPNFMLRDVQTRFNQSNFDDFNTRFGISNFGIVFNNTRDDFSPGAWRGGSFGISISRLADFNGKFHYEGNNETSILDHFSRQAAGRLPANLPANALYTLAYEAFLINPLRYYDPGQPGDLYAPIVFDDQLPYQIESVDTRGSHYQLTFGYGGNFNDRFYFGGNIGLGMLRYESNKLYTEYFDIEQIVYPDEYPGVDFTIDEGLTLNGIGINGSLGFIYRPNNMVRFGASITSPTFYNFRDERTSDLLAYYSQIVDGEFYEDYIINEDTLEDFFIPSDLLQSSYSIRTPAKYSAGMSVFFGKHGFISADVDYLNYGRSIFSTRDFESSDVNNSIRNLYNNAVNFRIGGEYRIDVFRLRAGYAYTGDPYAGGNISRARTTYTAGAGIRLRSFFFDLAYQNSSFSNAYSPYAADLFGPPVRVNNKVANMTASVGFLF